MQTTLLQYYMNGDIYLLKEYLLTVPVFNEIYCFLDNDTFYSLLKSIQVHPVVGSQPFQLKPNSTYVFLSPGILISKRERRHNYHKLTRLSRTIKLTQIYLTNDSIIDQQKPRQSESLRSVQKNQLFNQPLLYSKNYVGQNLCFVTSQQKKTSIIQIDFNCFPEDILEEIRQKHNQKFKFISSLPVFTKVHKYLIENNLKKFQLLKLYFDEVLVRQSCLRSENLIFLYKGEAEVFVENGQDMKSYVTEAPATLGIEKIKYAKSVSEYCLCYLIDKNQAIEILKRNNQSKYRTSESEEQLNRLIESVTKDKQKQNDQQTLPPILSPRRDNSEQKSPYLERNYSTPAFPLSKTERNSPLLKSKPNIMINSSLKVPQNIKYRIKQHFPNFLNDQYSQFALKKSDFLMKKLDKNDSILYILKSRKPKQPQMEQINKKLKNQRLHKIQKCKQNIIHTKQQSLDRVNIRIYEEFQDSKIINKIRRKIDQDIIKKKKRNKNWKSIVQSNVSFNRISDLKV